MNSNSLTEAEAERRHAGPDRRLLPRVASRLLAKIYFEGLPDGLTGQVRDIGPGGLCIETPSRVTWNAVKRVSIDFPDGQARLRVMGRWQRDAPGRTGVLTGMEFLDLEAAEVHRLWMHLYRQAGDLASFLQERSELTGIDYDDAVDLAFFTRLVEFSAGDHLYRQGSIRTRGDSAFVVCQGRVCLEARTERTRSVYLEHAEEGGVFGGMPILAGVSHPETATADTDLLVLEIDPYSYRHLESSRPRAVRWVSQALMRRYAGRLAQLVDRPEIQPRPFARL